MSIWACALAISGAWLLAGLTANAQVSNINSAVIQPRVVFGLPNAVLVTNIDYPSIISFAETNAGTTNTAFAANQDVWQFATNDGAGAYLFQTNDYYTASMALTLTGNPISPRKEAGIAFNDVGGAISGQFILDTDAGEIVAFGGNLPFYAFPFTHTFQSGQTVVMGVTIFKDNNGNTAIIYSANGTNSPALEFNQNTVYLANGTTPAPYYLGGYFQVQGQGTGATNLGSAAFSNISISAAPPFSTLGPPLNIAGQPGNQVVIFWPASASNFTLQSVTSLTNTNWVNVVGTPITGVIVPNAQQSQFFRLQNP